LFFESTISLKSAKRRNRLDGGTTINKQIIFMVIASSIGALIVLGGLALLLVGFKFNDGSEIKGGFFLIVFGALAEIILAYKSASNSSN